MLNKPTFVHDIATSIVALVPGAGVVPRDCQPIVSLPHLSHNLNPSV